MDKESHLTRSNSNNGTWERGIASETGGSVQHNSLVNANWNFPTWNSGAFWGPCIYRNAVCCSGEDWLP